MISLIKTHSIFSARYANIFIYIIIVLLWLFFPVETREMLFFLLLLLFVHFFICGEIFQFGMWIFAEENCKMLKNFNDYFWYGKCDLFNI